jgi:hypothetical protein
MRFIGKTKIGKVQPNAKSTYPILRLPPECEDVIGARAHLYGLQFDGQRAIIAVFGEQSNAEIMHKLYNIIQSPRDLHVDNRLYSLESEIREVKSFLRLKEPVTIHKKENNADAEWARPDSDRRPPPCEDGGFGGF